ncbi:16S rRNA (guanine(527)-N(7))-methyltransferase RsmG [Oricola sp.]|uniref:16S rRNA (guanine(527)-N(7))-methyltransferase RsmG n=1 Tax=Oricola sp. TaxID=1979950 RepID=UPI0025F159FE|nr:16S rRNA (guanine(527)-N(7))-methyltransferase RsmG [Oricola sp.]MCI5077518.1 16S rRNA (guanine(527)-N(7))-methyltransferase RsmG [Oricola sp.]
MRNRFDSEIPSDLLADVSRETLRRLEDYAALYEKWSPRINLTAPSTQNDFWRRHVADSAQILDLAPQACHWVDLGSGGGFPGMVIAILLQDRPEARVELVESNRKKTAFLQAVKAQCAPSVLIHPARIGDVVGRSAAPEIVTARALAALPALLDMTAVWLQAETRALFHKGRGYSAEIEESRARWDFDLVRHESRIDADSVILEISNLRPRSA